MVEALAERPEVDLIKETTVATPQQIPLPDSSKIDLEGEIAHAANDARTKYKTTGSGVKVCVISTSVRYLQQAQQNGSLPSDVEVLLGQDGLDLDGFGSPNPINPGEGTAMLEIVHRIAPGATLAFATGIGGENGMAKNIQDLVKDKCDIIVDDIIYWSEPPFQDGMIAKEVNAASAQGVLYVSAAGNDGHLGAMSDSTPPNPIPPNVWEGNFVAVPGAVPYQKFSSQTGQDPRFNKMWSSPQRVVLSWNDPLSSWEQGSDPAKRSHYRVEVYDAAGKLINASTASLDSPSASVILSGSPAYQAANLAIVQEPSSSPKTYLRLTATGGPASGGLLNYGTHGMTSGHNAAWAALTVGAVSAKGATGPFTASSGPVEHFSSDGPRRIFYNPDGSPVSPTGFLDLPKPDVMGADGITTDVPGWAPDNKDEFSPFFGTSAAAPHVAAIAALLMSYQPKPRLTVPLLKWYLEFGASVSHFIEGKSNNPVLSPIFGHGIVMPGDSLEQIHTPAPLRYNSYYFIKNLNEGYLSLNRNSNCQNADSCVFTKEYITGGETGGLWAIEPVGQQKTTYVMPGDLIRIFTVLPGNQKVYLNSTEGCPNDYHCVSGSFNGNLDSATWTLTKSNPIRNMADPMLWNNWADFHAGDLSTEVMEFNKWIDVGCINCVFTSHLFQGSWLWNFCEINPYPLGAFDSRRDAFCRAWAPGQ